MNTFTRALAALAPFNVPRHVTTLLETKNAPSQRDVLCRVDFLLEGLGLHEAQVALAPVYLCVPGR